MQDFLLTATVSGEALEFLAREVPTAVFFYGFQESYPGAECFARMELGEARQTVVGMEAWADALLCRAMVDPALTPETLQRLGSARDELAVAYLQAVGWIPPDPDRPPPVVQSAPARVHSEDRPALMALPTPVIHRGLRELSAKVRVPPFEIWTRWGIVECWWTWRFALQDEMKKRADRAATLMDRVGREG